MPELTYDPTPADQPEFNEAEQEALKVGEARMAEEQQLLAGKFTDAEELEKAYIELQRKMGSGKAYVRGCPSHVRAKFGPVLGELQSAPGVLRKHTQIWKVCMVTEAVG